MPQPPDLQILSDTLEDAKFRAFDIQIRERIYDEMHHIMLDKGHDYSGTAHTFANFEVAAELINQNVNLSFLFLIATKFARLIALLASGFEPRNESMQDSLLDCANYLVLWVAYTRWKHSDKQTVERDEN